VFVLTIPHLKSPSGGGEGRGVSLCGSTGMGPPQTNESLRGARRVDNKVNASNVVKKAQIGENPQRKRRRNPREGRKHLQFRKIRLPTPGHKRNGETFPSKKWRKDEVHEQPGVFFTQPLSKGTSGRNNETTGKIITEEAKFQKTHGH